jgi:2-polyprenyl-6-methoxyphenol hydroxylase-like FAD-dependent oxidoreductase
MNSTDVVERLDTRCAIVGGGPAGMMLGFLLARAGVDCIVLEKHGDFLRDFRGDTIHPSTLEVMHELGLLDDFLKRPHQEVQQIRGCIGNMEVTLADFTHLPTRCKFLAFMPQWDFLNFLVEHAAAYPTFHLRLNTDVRDLLETDGKVIGVRAAGPRGNVEIRSALVVGADGRNSIIRERAGLVVHDVGAPIDVLWMRISRHQSDPYVPLGRFDRGRVFVMIYRGDYWQCGYVIAKGGYDDIRAEGIEKFRQAVRDIAPFLGDRVNELRDWDDIKLLTVKVDRLDRWYREGLLCIGDAAHAMSPVGGVGINLAIQDAVASANLLAEPLRAGAVTLADLHRVERRRRLPTRLTQWAQVEIQNRVISRALASEVDFSPPRIVRMLEKWPRLRRIPARLIGLGVRPEHVETEDAFAARR